MEITKEQKALNIKNQLQNNFKLIEKLNSENIRLINSLSGLNLFPLISDEDKKRYDNNLVTDDWMNYSHKKFAVIYDLELFENTGKYNFNIYAQFIDEDVADKMLYKLINETKSLSLKNLRKISMYNLTKLKQNDK